MPKAVPPVPYKGDANRHTGNVALPKFVRLSMNDIGIPSGLITSNLSVTD